MSIFHKKPKDIEKGFIVDLNALKSRIERLPSQYPVHAQVYGAGAGQAQQQIPIICRNIDEAMAALKTDRDPYGNPITVEQVGTGLGRLVEASQKPAFTGLMMAALSPEGVYELEKCMNDLATIARKLELL